MTGLTVLAAPASAAGPKRVARFAPSKKVRERYVRPELGTPAWLRQARGVLVVPMASSLDDFGDVFAAALENMPRRKAPFMLVVLASVVERLVHLGFRNTLERARLFLERFGGVNDTAHYLANTFMVDDNDKVLDTALDALQWMRWVLDAQNKGAALVVVTENPEFTRLAAARHLQVMTTCEFVARQGMDDLVDLAQGIRAALQEAEAVQDTETTASGPDSEPWKQPFWTDKEIERNLASNEAFRGKFQRNKLFADEVTIVRPGNIPDITFKARSVNRAVHEDDVVVQGRRIVAVEKRNWRPYVATLARADAEKAAASAGSSLSLLCVPLDVRIPKVRITTRQGANLVDQRFVVALDDWPQGSKYPHGHYVRTLGPIGEVPAESSAIIVETGLAAHLQPFTPKALACLPPEEHRWTPPAEEIKKRRDLRDAFIFSVDPPSCQDIDDTMSFQVLADGAVQVGVHIADVTHFLAAGSALDLEAQKRATSVYLKDRRLDMLPRLLCEDLCSLRAGVDRLAVSVVWTIDHPTEGDEGLTVRDVWSGRTVIRSAQALSYAQAQRLIDGQDPLHETAPEYASSHTGKPVPENHVEPLRQALRGLQCCARIRARQRQHNGALELQGEEFQFGLDASQRPDSIVSKRKLEVHDIVAEMMILANEQVARQIVHTDPRLALVRRHAKPPDKKLGFILKLAHEAGVMLDTRSNASLAASMARARGVVSSDVFAVLNDGLTRAMSEAEYTCAGEVADISHFGLGLDFYTHFTSPIRRYADVIVHRQLLQPAISSSLSSSSSSSSTSSNVLPGEEDKVDNATSLGKKAFLNDKPASSHWLAAAERASRDAELLFGDLDHQPATSNQGQGRTGGGGKASGGGGGGGGDDLLGDLLDGLDDDSGDGPDLDDILGGGFGTTDDAALDTLLLDTTAQSASAQTRQVKEGEQGEENQEGVLGSLRGMPDTQMTLQHQAEHINRLHRAAKEASFRSEELFFSLYFQRNPQVSMAVAVKIRDLGILCYVPRFQSKLLLRFDSECTLHVGRTDDAGIVSVDLVHDVVFNFEDADGALDSGSQSYARVNLSSVNISALEHTSIEVLQAFPVYISCDAPQDNPARRIPKPKLILYAPSSTEERRRLLADPPGKSGTQAVKAFAQEASPSLVKRNNQSVGAATQDSVHLKNPNAKKRFTPPSLYSALQAIDVNDSNPVLPPRSSRSTNRASTPQVASTRKGRGRLCFGGFESPELAAARARESRHAALDATASDQVHHHGAPESFTRIQGDHRAVDNYVRNVTRDVTRRLEGLAKAKRETKIKRRLKQG